MQGAGCRVQASGIKDQVSGFMVRQPPPPPRLQVLDLETPFAAFANIWNEDDAEEVDEYAAPG